MDNPQVQIANRADVENLKENYYARITDQSYFEQLSLEERPPFLKKVRKSLKPQGVYTVYSRNRKNLESEGKKEAHRFLYFNEFILSFVSEFNKTTFKGKNEISPRNYEGMSEFDPWFSAQIGCEEPKLRVLILAESDEQVLVGLRSLQSLGYEGEGCLLYPFQEIAYKEGFTLHHIRGVTQLHFVWKLVSPKVVLAIGNLKNVAKEFAASHGAIFLENINELQNFSLSDRIISSSEAPLPNKKIGVAWEGSFFVHHSLSRVNEEIAAELNKEEFALSLCPYEYPQFSENMDRRFLSLKSRFFELPSKIDFHVRHHWPPQWELPAEGEFVLMQPWEFGILPSYWLQCLPRVREVWAYTHFVKDTYVRSGVPEERVQVVPLGVNSEIFSPLGESLNLKTRNSFRFLYVGGLIGRKGVDLLLKAYLEEFKPHENVCLVIRDFYYKSAWSESLKVLSQRQDVPEIVHFTEPLLPSKIPSLYRACQAYVQPYRGEGFGLPILEAMACGLPVIVTGYGAALDFCHSGNAYLVPARLKLEEQAAIDTLETIDKPFMAEVDLLALRRSLREVYSNYVEASHRGLLAAQEVNQEWTWKQSARAVEERLFCLKNSIAKPFALASPHSTKKYVEAYNQTPPDLEQTGHSKSSWAFLQAYRMLDCDVNQAESFFQKALSWPGWTGEALYGLAKISIKRGQLEEALHRLEEVNDKVPFHRLAWRDMAEVSKTLGQDEKAALAMLEANRGSHAV